MGGDTWTSYLEDNVRNSFGPKNAKLTISTYNLNDKPAVFSSFILNNDIASLNGSVLIMLTKRVSATGTEDRQKSLGVLDLRVVQAVKRMDHYIHD
jgi:hypothetical protein